MQYAHRENNVRLVLDTNTVVSGLLWDGRPRQLLEYGRDRLITLLTSSELLDELFEVLGREKFATMLASQGMSQSCLLQRYGALIELVVPRPLERTVRDVDDDVVIATALAAQAEIIVSGDDDLLTLHSWQGIQILNAADALQHIQSKTEWSVHEQSPSVY